MAGIAQKGLNDIGDITNNLNDAASSLYYYGTASNANLIFTGAYTRVNRNNTGSARVLVNDKGLANGVQYFDRRTKEEHKVRARVVMMGASCVDSTRILLNSKSSAHPNGIGNSSDAIGRYLCEQIRFHVYAFLPELLGGPVHDDSGIGGEHIYMPRFIIAMGASAITCAGSACSSGDAARKAELVLRKHSLALA